MKTTTVIAAIALAAACATSPTGRHQLILMPDSEMAQLGAQSFTQIEKETPVSSNGTEVHYVTCIADAITKVLPSEYQGQWDVKVFQSDQVNAFALPGKKIGVYSALLKVATNQDMVATVLGHEVGHVLARHGNERVSENVVLEGGMGVLEAFSGGSSQTKQMIMGALGVGAQYGIQLPHSRTQEAEADRIGLDLMAKAGFNPEQSVALWHNMDKAMGSSMPPAWMSDHPANASRIQDLENGMAKAKQEQQAANAAGLHPQCGGSGVALHDPTRQ